jgi:hypothetical protein
MQVGWEARGFHLNEQPGSHAGGELDTPEQPGSHAGGEVQNSWKHTCLSTSSASDEVGMVRRDEVTLVIARCLPYSDCDRSC